jgi:hypothetical protein
VKALATIGIGPMRPVLDVALMSFRPYAERHGYDLVVGSGESDERPPSWGKVLLLRRLLETYEEILWLDSDMVIVDDEIDIASVIPPEAFQALVCHPQREGDLAPNVGLWFLRARKEARSFLDSVWASEQHIHGHGMWENLAVLELLGYTTQRPYRLERRSPWADGTHHLPGEWNYNPSSLWSPPDTRILHFCARANDLRVRRMRLAMLKPPRSLKGKVEFGLRRMELSMYFRRRGVSDRTAYREDRFVV